jgi:SAM-dependent methyltransferase
MAFKDHFSGHASDYAISRPAYPPALFDWLFDQCSGNSLAWDAGCGNGQASLALTTRFESVFASDPSSAQIANAASHPRIRYMVEAAEKCSLGDGRADLIIVAQAYHWFDHARFCAEATRVLAPEGVIAVLSYAESQVSAEVDTVFDELHNRRLGEDWPAGRDHVISRYRDLPFPFTPLATPIFEMRSDWNLEQYLAYLRSWSASQRYQRRTGRDAVAEITPAMSAAWGEPQLIRPVKWPLLVLAGRRPEH